MCYTVGCWTDHATLTVRQRTALAMATDQGEQYYDWDWPIETGHPPPHHRQRRADVEP